jgi:diguanylate cyclase (GGDEF)-like protein
MLDDAEAKEVEKRIRELEWQVTQLQHDLIHDPLTGLKTRAYFEEQVGTYLAFPKKGREERKESFGFETLSIVFFDIDHFKKVNDTYGHEAGDAVLQDVAQAIKTSLRSGDTVARWGGEEMVASLLGASEAAAAAKAEEIRAKVAKLAFPGVPGLKVTISSGVATHETGEDLKTLVKRADQGLYKAKETGRNKVVRYSELKSS